MPKGSIVSELIKFAIGQTGSWYPGLFEEGSDFLDCLILCLRNFEEDVDDEENLSHNEEDKNIGTKCQL